MANIPDYTAVGQSIPTPAYRRPFIDQSGQIIARAGEGLGQTLEQVGDQDYTRSVNLARAQASNALLDHEISVKDTVENVRQAVASGQLPWDQAGQEYQTQISKLQPPSVANLDPIGQENLDKGMKRNVLGGAVSVLGIARAGQHQAFADQFQGAMDKLGKLAGMPNADIDSINGQIDSYRPMALAADIKPEDFDKAAQAFKDRNWLNQATQRSMEAKDNMGALQGLEHDLTASDGFYAGRLDTEKRNMVLRTVINDRLVLQNRIEHEQDRREAKAAGAMNQYNEQVASGIPATPAMLDRWESLTKGTSLEGDFQQAQQNETQVQEVLRKPIDQQIRYVQDQQAKLDTEGGSLRDRANIMRLTTAVNQNANLMQSNPLIFAANRTGAETQPIDFKGLNSGDGKQQIGDEIADRMSTIQALRKQYGPQIGMQPLLPQEASALRSQLETAKPQERVQILTGLRDAVNNDDAYQAIMRRVAPGSPVTAVAGQMTGASSPASTPAWYDRSFAPHTADVTRVIMGESLLNPRTGGKEGEAETEAGKGGMKNGIPLPPEQQLRLTYGDETRGLFNNPQDAEARYAAFKAAYAGLLAEHSDYRGVGDSGLERQALNIALGNRVTFNGQSLAVPPGMDPSRFTGLVNTAVADAARTAKAPQDWQERLRGFGLQEVDGYGSGRYELLSGGAPIIRPDGAGKLVIDLRKQFLPGTSGAAASKQVLGNAELDPMNKFQMARAVDAAAAAQKP